MNNLIWHTKSLEEVEKVLQTSLDQGLSEQESARRLEKYGSNELEHKGRKSIWGMLVEQFKDFMVIILIIAAAVSGILGETTDAIIILIIVGLNAILGVVQENKAEESLEALKNMAAPHAKVKRGGSPDVIDAANLVPGDVVVLEAGDFVPADIRLIETSNVKIEEAALTGESVPVDKGNAPLPGDDIPLGDRVNMAYSGSIVTYGRGVGIVVETGMSTQMGRIAEMIQSEEGVRTPLQKRLESLGKILGIAALGICGLIFVVGVLYGKDIFDMFFTSVSLAVAAIPEGLPAIVTIVLAIGVQRMAKRNAIIRKLPAIETLGSATVICSDKTGTLTQNKMTVKQLYYNHMDQDIVDGSQNDNHHLELLILAGVLCNDTQIKETEEGLDTIGDPTETALVDLGLNYGLDKRSLDQDIKRVYELPFDSERKLMTTVHGVDNGLRVFTKGGTDELLNKCNKILLNGNAEALTQQHIADIQRANEAMASKALRVLAMAYKDIDEIPNQEDGGQLESDLTLIGLMGMIDPPREEAKEAVKLCKRAGIKPIMITGDHKITAVAIAKELGILGERDEAITGAEVEAMRDEELKEKVKHISVYARVAPEHKVRIVKAWQEWGQIVAMTGDGVNDAPALKRADIGAAMGIVGTDVAKEAADMVLTDDNFSTIVSAVEEGRIIFSNILKSIQFLLSCNVGEILLLFIATMLNWREPLLPIHILWVNLVTDSLPALALGVDPAEADIMNRRPRDPKRSIFDSGMIIRIVYQGTMVGLLALIAFVIGQRIDLITGRTMTFAVLALSQLIHTFNVRSNTKSLFTIGFLTNIKLLWAIAFSALLQISVIVLPPLSNIFKVRALDG
ncbi:MAG TPA: calcium-translocating P-type ATPase, PMCA-type, partial [Clostridia bacterium]|nr:calcium-translocating P-type ATPase, PMCA-type [Clostridia bacterium]